jgi:hypothetical protein
MQTSNWFKVRVVKLKNAVKEGITSNKKAIVIVIPIINGTKLFLYFSVVKIEK